MPGSFSGVVAVRELLKPRKHTGMLVVGAGGCQRTVQTPKTSSHARFQGWWQLEKGRNPEDEQSCSFSGLMVARER
jgi:hypothetical protein